MEKLILQLDNYEQLIANFVTNTQKAGKQALTKGHLQGRRTLLEKNWEKVESLHCELIQNPSDDHAKEYIASDLFLKIEMSYTNSLGWVLDYITTFEQPPIFNNENPIGQQPPTHQQHARQAEIKLPAIVIPKFAGDFSTWTSFHDLFEALVIKNNSLSNVNKLHHLKSSLTGEAELVLRHFNIEENNFQPAWDLLKRRFANKRLLVNAQFSKLLGQQKISNGSAELIRRILDISTESITSLKAQLENEQQFDAILIYILTQKLDTKTVEAWELTRNDIDDFPTFIEFSTFLENRCRMYDLVQGSTKLIDSKLNSKGKPEPRHNIKSFQTSTKSSMQCTHCGKPNHLIYKCHQFRALPVQERQSIVRNRGWCKLCLSSQHKTDECTHSWVCTKCHGKHNNLLHQADDSSSASHSASTQIKPTSTAYTSTSNQTNLGINHHTSDFKLSHSLLATAQICITSSYGKSFQFRALIDPGSEACLISRAAANVLQLPLHKINAHIKAMGGTSVGSSKHLLSCTIQSIHNKQSSIAIDAVIMPRLTNVRPPSCLQSTSWPHLQGIQLADPCYYKPDKIDLVLGADTFYDLFLPDIRKGPRGSPSAQQTILGYILIGQIFESASANTNVEPREIVSYYSEVSVCEQLQKFWEIEEVPQTNKWTTDEEVCESHYQATHHRKLDGRYCVDLPFKTVDHTPPMFGNSRSQALSRLCQLERRFLNKPELYKQYKDFLEEYVSLGHMHQVVQQPSIGPAFYLPHHAILRPTSLTTKIRVVFDASAKDSSGKSLNDTLLIGPTIQDSLHSILLRWRKHKYAITADAEKMYRQIEINPHHQQYQRILWRDEDHNLVEYELSTVTYGTASAPFQAIRTLHQLAQDDKQKYPLASERTIKDMYVDDFISGGESIEETEILQREMVQLFQSGGFKLRKWSSNSTQLLEKIPAPSRESTTCLDICHENIVKTLGVMWHTRVDEFHFVVNLAEQPNTFSKRTFLSDVAKLFDPFGFLAPIIISAKILFQSLWLRGIAWDDPLPDDITNEWLSIRSKLGEITKIKIPRWLGISSKCRQIEYHGFCDASLKAYAAAIYCRTTNNGHVSVQLLTAKTRVAPVKQVSLPNLELCGAELLAKLMDKVKSAMDIEAEIFAWTDSTIVLDWIRSNSHKKVFVANRITKILEHLTPAQWRHIRSKDNPADVASRGICPSQLPQHALWWHGPMWLQESAEKWPKLIKREERIEDIIVATTIVDDDFSAIIEKFSSHDKLIRVITKCVLFARKCRSKESSINSTASDYRNTLGRLIKYVQSISYHEEMRLLRKSECPSKLASLSPFICSDGFLRVGGRLNNSNLKFGQKHPILLPREHHLTKLIISRIHSYTLHGGIKLTLATLRQNYWITNARTTIRGVIHRCIICHRYATHNKNQLMSALPAARVRQSKVFAHTGVDYAGPFNLRLSKHRGRGTFKGFVAVFVCLATKAVHLEVASDLTAQTFIAAFKRFVSRRGPCSDLYSDNGTNFVGANRVLKSSFEEAMTEISKEAAESLAIKGTNWHFIPANSPHFGGLWEAAVKSFKYHLKRIVDHTILTYEEFATMLTEIEASLNSRPLCKLSSDPCDLNALTPGHLLTGGPLNTIPEPSVLQLHENRLTRWKFLLKLHQDFWHAWSHDYLHELQQRPKRWTQSRENLQEGDVVIVKDERLPPSNWLLARVIQTHPGADGIVRVVTIQHKSGQMKRAANRVCRLPIESQ